MNWSNNYKGLIVVMILLGFLKDQYHFCNAADPTNGFTLVPLKSQNFKLDKPYNEPLRNRYSYKDGVRRFWIYNRDKPFKPSSTTRPRTEVRIDVFLSLPLYISI